MVVPLCAGSNSSVRRTEAGNPRMSAPPSVADVEPAGAMPSPTTHAFRMVLGMGSRRRHQRTWADVPRSRSRWSSPAIARAGRPAPATSCRSACRRPWRCASASESRGHTRRLRHQVNDGTSWLRSRVLRLTTRASRGVRAASHCATVCLVSPSRSRQRPSSRSAAGSETGRGGIVAASCYVTCVGLCRPPRRARHLHPVSVVR